MPCIEYVSKRFSAEHRVIIDRANQVITEYAAAGYDLTLRQLYYQFVSRNWLPNNDRSYKRLGSVISDARRAGEIDWERIVDRTRNVRIPPAWDNPADIVSACARQFATDRWAGQPYRAEVWVEKDALVGVLETACAPWRCPYFSCRGYTSDSEVWGAAQRLSGYADKGQTPIVFHLGDHDPSGIDMSRDIMDRLEMFGTADIEVRRLALNMDQIRQYNPPPNPAKQTDCRYTGYAEEYGTESWELDALEPTVIGDLIAAAMREIVEPDAWAAASADEAEGRRLLTVVAQQWGSLTGSL